MIRKLQLILHMQELSISVIESKIHMCNVNTSEKSEEKRLISRLIVTETQLETNREKGVALSSDNLVTWFIDQGIRLARAEENLRITEVDLEVATSSLTGGLRDQSRLSYLETHDAQQLRLRCRRADQKFSDETAQRFWFQRSS